MEELRCLVCQGQSIADSDAEIAGDMRHLVRSRIAAGENPSQIRAWLVERYGDWISYRPPDKPIGWPLWGAPLVLLALGALLVTQAHQGRAAMSGWAILIALFALAIGAFRLLGLRGAMLQLATAALLLGASGYALQGRPGLAGSPRAEAASKTVIPLTRMRNAFFGEFTRSGHWLLMSDSMARKGRTADAAGLLRSAVREHPNDPALWVGLGNALVDHSGVLTPAAQFSYQRAMELAPGHPAAPFFLGLALVRSGDPASAIVLWRQILSEAPADASWRPLVEDAIAALESPPPHGGGVGAVATTEGALFAPPPALRATSPGGGGIRPARTPGRALQRPLGGGSCRPRR